VSETFGARYADAYDPLYADKDYAIECDLIEILAARHGSQNGAVLDLGCGTGRHAVILANRGWRVIGVDRSEEMLSIARQRAAQAGVDELEFLAGDVRSVRVDGEFDVALLMFAVLGYQLTDSDVAATLATAAAHLRPGGVLLFDVWNGSAVEKTGPSARIKSVVKDGSVIRRRAEGVLDRARRTCTVDYRIDWLDGATIARSLQERHTVRYFFEPEVRRMTRDAGLDIVASGAFPEFDSPIDSTRWNALYVAKAPA
jgi:SAM-dependent methyltransferase